MNEQRPAFSADHCKVDMAHKENITFYNPMDEVETLLVTALDNINKAIVANAISKPAPKVQDKDDLLMALNQMLIFVNNDYAGNLIQVIGIIGQLEEM